MSNHFHRSPLSSRHAVLTALILLLLIPLLAACGSEPTPNAVAGENLALASVVAEANSQASLARTPTPKPRVTATPTRRASAKTPTPTPKSKGKATPTARAPGQSGLPTIRYQDLPNQAKETIALIDKGGPFPFDRDGITFQNREQLLPKKPNGYYQEYTVITPGSSDRGARRMIAGARGELYYTDDHYESFREVMR